MKVSKLRPFSIAMASLMTSSAAFAAMDMDSRVSQLEEQMSQVRTETSMGTYGAKTATARVDVDGYGFFFDVDLLYWHAKVGGTEYAYTDQGSVGATPIKGRTKDVGFDWDWGFRLGLGYNLDHDGWDVRTQYTYFNSSGSDSARPGSNSSVVPLRGSPSITDPQFRFSNSGKSQFGFDFQSLDLELGRAYYLSSNLSVRSFWGLKSAWIDLEQVTRYTGGEPTVDALGLQGTTVRVKDESDFWGLGPRVGLDSTWELANGFSIFGNVAGALLYGYFDVDHREKWSNNPDSRIKVQANRHAFSPSVQMQIGLRYDKYMNDNKQHLGIGLGYEANYWWRQNQMLSVHHGDVLNYDRYSEDVSMHGVTLDIKWDF